MKATVNDGNKRGCVKEMKTERSKCVPHGILFVMLWAGQAVICLHAQSSTMAGQQGSATTQPKASAPTSQIDVDLHRAAKDADLPLLRSRLEQGADPNGKDLSGHTALFDAVSAGRLEAARVLLEAGAKAGIGSADGRTPLIEASAQGRLDIAQLLIRAGADLNAIQRGAGTALQIAERYGHNDVAAFLLQAGARSSGRSVGDMVCVRPWKGDGYCGAVTAVNKTEFTVHIIRVVGCAGGCAAKAECSSGRSVGGAEGLQAGEVVTTRSWCLTDTGVQP
jgi:hypothetical protein